MLKAIQSCSFVIFENVFTNSVGNSAAICSELLTSCCRMTTQLYLRHLKESFFSINHELSFIFANVLLN